MMRGVVMLPTDVKVPTGCPAALEVVLGISKTTNKCTDSNVHSPSHADFISVLLEVAAILLSGGRKYKVQRHPRASDAVRARRSSPSRCRVRYCARKPA